MYIYESQLEETGVDAPGWYDGDGVCYNNTPLALGTGFLTSFGTTSEISIQNSGEVYGEAPTIDCTGNKYQVIPNPLPRRIQYKEITPTGFNYENDELRIIKPATSGTKIGLMYIYKNQLEETGVDAPGWYDGEGVCYNDENIEVGEGFLLSSGSLAIQFSFLKAIK